MVVTVHIGTSADSYVLTRSAPFPVIDDMVYMVVGSAIWGTPSYLVYFSVSEYRITDNKVVVCTKVHEALSIFVYHPKSMSYHSAVVVAVVRSNFAFRYPITINMSC